MRKKKIIEKPSLEMVETNGDIKLEYKGWLIMAIVNPQGIIEGKVSVMIQNKKLGIAQLIYRTCHIEDVYRERNMGSLLNPKIEIEHTKKYREFETIQELMIEAKDIVDFFELLKESVLKETKIVELSIGFGKVEVKKDRSK